MISYQEQLIMSCCIPKIEKDLVLRYKMIWNRVYKAQQELSISHREVSIHQEKHFKHKGV